jgi:hypothetical protein
MSRFMKHIKHDLLVYRSSEASRYYVRNVVWLSAFLHVNIV